ncbi:MAG: dihydrofolate reductase [Candidatus Liptonbacteria bacterium]|nr:dihydrofolate reductase [Candidatus Liptonbacteria bacterium]
MRTILAAVVSVDGKITRGSRSGTSEWASVADKKYFARLIQESDAIVMGSQTYATAKKYMKLSPERLRIILTRNPQKYRKYEIPGQLEFSNDSPRAIIRRLSRQKYKRVLVAGGGEINALFLKANLIQHICLTVEPKIFGTGKNIVHPVKMIKNLKLISVRRLNRQGTLLSRYDVIQ